MKIVRAFPRHTVRFPDGIRGTIYDNYKNKELTEGPHVSRFEELFASYHRVDHAVGVSSGRIGLYLALQALGFEAGDEIILPSYTFYEVPLTIQLCGFRPIFIDSSSETFNLDVSLLKRRITKKTKAILATHIYGQPCDMDPIMEVASDHGLMVIEDCAHACGAEYKGRKVGSIGDIGVFSFALGKNMPCFGGGVLITDSDRIHSKARMLVDDWSFPDSRDIAAIFLKHIISQYSTKRSIFPYMTYPLLRILDTFHIALSSYRDDRIEGYNRSPMSYNKKMLNFQAAVGIRQMETLDMANATLRENAHLYNFLLSDVRHLQTPLEIPETTGIFLYYYVLCENREEVRRKLLKKGVDTERNNLSSCASLEVFRTSYVHCPVAERLTREGMEMPNNVYMTKDDVRYIADCIKYLFS